MTELFLEILAWSSAMAGSFLLLAGGIGMLRMPGFFPRVHAAGLIDTLGTLLLLLALMLHIGWDPAIFKIALIAVLTIITMPASVHAMCKVARHHGVKE